MPVSDHARSGFAREVRLETKKVHAYGQEGAVL